MILLTERPHHYIGRCHIVAVFRLFFGWLISLPFWCNCALVFIIGDWSCLFALEMVPIWMATHPSCCSWWFVYWMAVARFSWSTRMRLLYVSADVWQCCFVYRNHRYLFGFWGFCQIFPVVHSSQCFLVNVGCIIYYVPYVLLWSELGLSCAIENITIRISLWSYRSHVGHVALL